MEGSAGECVANFRIREGMAYSIYKDTKQGGKDEHELNDTSLSGGSISHPASESKAPSFLNGSIVMPACSH